METERLMTVSDAARISRMHPQTFRRLLNNETIPGLVKIGRGYRVDERLFGAWLRGGGSRGR